LISFDEALTTCRDENRMKLTVFSKHLVMNQDQEKAIRRLKDTFRNTFEHFPPMSFEISLHDLPKMCLECLPVVEFLALKTGNYSHLSLNERERISFIVHQSAHLLRSCLLFKESVSNIQNHEIQMGILLGATAHIRGEQESEDLKEILASSPPEKHYAKLICKYGIRLESYICEDFCPERTLAGGLSRTVTFGRVAEQYFKQINAAFKML
jgi:hypothetical protein